MQLMVGPRGSLMPSYVLFADDIMIFSRASKRSLFNLLQLFQSYEQVSGQVISKEKSKFFVGSVSHSRIRSISELLGFSVSSLPFIYLGVPLFKGKPKKIHLQPIADKIKSKLSSWKGSILSIMGIVELVKSVIFSMLVYSFRVYSWPSNLLNLVDKWIKNFVWSGDLYVRKMITVAWGKICKSFNEGGLGLRSITVLTMLPC